MAIDPATEKERALFLQDLFRPQDTGTTRSMSIKVYTPAEETLRALQVITLTPHIHKYLKEHDPQALKQCLEAVRKATEE